VLVGVINNEDETKTESQKTGGRACAVKGRLKNEDGRYAEIDTSRNEGETVMKQEVFVAVLSSNPAPR